MPDPSVVNIYSLVSQVGAVNDSDAIEFALNDTVAAGLSLRKRLEEWGVKPTNDVFSGFGTTVFE